MADSGFRLDGRVAVVTGGSQGIGRAVSLALAEAGAAVAVTNVRQKKGDVDALCAEITACGGTAKGYEPDGTAPPTLPSGIARTPARLGGPSTPVHQPAGPPARPRAAHPGVQGGGGGQRPRRGAGQRRGVPGVGGAGGGIP